MRLQLLPALGLAALLTACEASSNTENSATDGGQAPVQDATSGMENAGQDLDAALEEVDIPTQDELDAAAEAAIDANNEDEEFERLWDEVMGEDG